MLEVAHQSSAFNTVFRGFYITADPFQEVVFSRKVRKGIKAVGAGEGGKGGWIRSGDVILMSVGSPWRISCY